MSEPDGPPSPECELAWFASRMTGSQKGVEHMKRTDLRRTATEEPAAGRIRELRKLKRVRRPNLPVATGAWVLALTALAALIQVRSAAQAPPPFSPSANPVSDA